MVSVVDRALLETSFAQPRSGAARLGPETRKELGVRALAGAEPVVGLAATHDVSRKFVYAQAAKVDAALDEAFRPSPHEDEDRVLFYLPVTAQWIRQLVLALLLHCHSSYRGVMSVLADLFDHPIAIGQIHNIVSNAVDQAREINRCEDLSKIRVGAHDEIFQGRQPILVGVDPISSYCYLLAPAEARDETTWGVHLLECSERGLQLDYTVADAGQGLRAGQSAAWPEVPCRGDVFHIQAEITKMTTYLSNRAYGTIGACEKLERQMERAKKRRKGTSYSKKLALARAAKSKAVRLFDDVETLAQWLSQDVLALVGPQADERRELYDFIVAELRALEANAPHRIRPARVSLENQRDQLLAFAEEIDTRLADIAEEHHVPLVDVRRVFELGRYGSADPRRWSEDAALWKRLGSRYPAVQRAVNTAASLIVRASSIVENFNGRLRVYISLRRRIGPAYLELLRFFFNHRRYPRSRKPARQGKSPAEVLHRETQPHWLEQLGFTRFRRAS